MTDRELLEDAAKAAGIEHDGVRYRGQGEGWGLRLAGTMTLWNPLTDDGDEARLEAALEITVQWCESGVNAWRGPRGVYHEAYADHGGDRQKARRRAGVRAAAQMAPGVICTNR